MLTFDLSAFERQAARIGGMADQIPFAISRALNDAAYSTETRLATDTWAKHTANRDKNFLKAMLNVEKASKGKLRVALYDERKRGHLAEHANGGVVRGRGNLSIPTARVARGPRGIQPSQKPRDLKRSVRKGDLIFQATGKGKDQRLQLMFKLQPSYRIKRDVPLVEDFRRFMGEEVQKAFPKAMAQAMRTRR